MNEELDEMTQSREGYCFEDYFTGEKVQVADPNFQGMQGVTVMINGKKNSKE